MRKLFLTFVFILLSVIFIFAGGTPVEPEGLSWGVILLIIGVIGSIIEIILRIVPSDKDYSWLNLILRIINAIVPNKAKAGIDGNDKAIFKVMKVLKRKR